MDENGVEVMLTIQPNTKPYCGRRNNFDILIDDETDYLDKHLRNMKGISYTKDWNPVPLGWFHRNPYKATEALGMNTMQMMVASAYKCPYLDSLYYSVVPTFLFTKDVTKYFNNFPDKWARDILSDVTYMRQNYGTTLDNFQSVMIGPGYTDTFSPYDGGHSVEQAHVVLSNGDLLVVAIWHWFNK